MKQPQSSILCDYQADVVLSVSAVGYGPISYEWKKDGKDIPHFECTGTDTDTLSIKRFSSRHQGSYGCMIKDHHSSVNTEPANLALSKYCPS